ncbi:MAG: T9SS type A sorting domain-containing protein [Dysgonamonadaceae bacterium]|jgi:hypothetical protein|nr:T9SS type A sorting domain-containing protein [Dysgonamonadaceae bacterium]
MPTILQLPGQPADFRITSHIININVPSVDAADWTEAKELNYIKRVFDIIPDKHFLILCYDGFYYVSGYTTAHSFHVQNHVQNIGIGPLDNSESYNSNKLLRITRLLVGSDINPNIVTHEIFHQWCTHKGTSNELNYWLADPSSHTGLVEDNTTVFENFRRKFQQTGPNLFSYRQGYSSGFAGRLEGYLAGLWDAPDNLVTIKNYWHDYDIVTFTDLGDYAEDFALVENVKGDALVTLSKSDLFNLYGGERIPSYRTSDNNYDAAIVLFTTNGFLSDDSLKLFHYRSVVLETEKSASEYVEKYNEVFYTRAVHNVYEGTPEYGLAMVNPYHASFKKLHFKTQIFAEYNDNGIDTFKSDADPSIWTYGNELFVNAPFNNTTVKVFTLAGVQFRQQQIQSGITRLTLPQGIYIVKVNGIAKKVVME